MTASERPLKELSVEELGYELEDVNAKMRILTVRKDEILKLLKARQIYITGILATCDTSTVAITSNSLLTELKFQTRFETRIQRRFHDGGIKTVGDLLAGGETTLYAPDFGKKSINEIKRVLTLHGLTLPKFSSK